MMAALPSYSNYLSAPGDLHVTLSVRSQSSMNDDSSIIHDDFIERSAPSTPEKRSGPHNLRRAGYSEEKCRYVLVKYCSSIPRNFNYAEGVQFVYEKLREHCGDENLDLSIGVLYEFIEVDTPFTFEQGAAFRRWQFDHSRRAVDLTNNHAPRMGNIIVGNIIPTERLRQWRTQNPLRQRGAKLSDSDSICLASRSSVATVSPHFGIAHRSVWHIENSLYVSSLRGGTTVLYCPTPQEMHERAWDESYGRGGRFIRTRRIGPDAISLMEFREPDAPKATMRERTIGIFLHAWPGSLSNVLKIRLPRERFRTIFILRFKRKPVPNPHQHCSVPVYEGTQEVMNLPDHDTEEGKAYYRNIKTAELPPGVEIPNAMFARKHDLAQVPGNLNRMGSVEDLAILKCLEANYEAETEGKRWSYRGPLTASLFKDGGIDYQWEVFEAPISGPSQQSRSDLTLSRYSYMSSGDDQLSDLSTLRIPAAPARSQRARSQSRRALQGGDDIIHHDRIQVAIHDSYDAARTYASWLRSEAEAEAHPFSENLNIVEEDDRSSASHFDRFASRLQGKLNISGLQTPRPSPDHAGEDRRQGGIRKRTAESVQARKHLLKKIITSDEAQDGDNNDDIVVNEKEEELPPLEKIITSDGAQDSDHGDIVLKEKEEELLPIVIPKNKNNNKKCCLVNKHCPVLAETILRSSFIKRISNALDYTASALVDKISEHAMAPPRPGVNDTIQVNSPFILGSPAPQNIRKLSEEYDAHKQQSARSTPSRQKQPPALASTMEEHHDEPRFPPRTSSRPRDKSTDIHEIQRPRANTESVPSLSSSKTRTSDESHQVMGNFTALGQSHDTTPTTSGSNRKKMNMQEAADRFHPKGPNPYEFRDSQDDRHMTTVTTVEDFLQRKFGNSIREATNLQQVPRHPVVINRGISPSTIKSTRPLGHVKNHSESNTNFVRRQQAPRAPTATSNHRQERAEYQQEYHHGYGLQRSRSSPAIGPPSDPAPSRAVDSYAAYNDYERTGQESDPDCYSGSTYLTESYDAPPSAPSVTTSRGRNSQPRGLGIESVQLENGGRDEVQNGEKASDGILADPFPPKRKRSRSPMKRMFGPGGFLGNSGALNSPADPQYVKPKTGGGMMTKIFKATIDNIAEIPRSLSPMKMPFRAEDKTPVRSKFPVSLSPPRQAKLYMELELLICATTNKFLMDQYRAGRMTPESVRKITEFWRNKGRPQVIEFQFDQATQRDLVVLNQRNFQFQGKDASNILQVNAMLHSWKENAREMAIRTFCMPDAVIQKQLHDSYKLLELFGAPMSTFVALHEIHTNFNRYVKKTVDNKEQIGAMIRATGVEQIVATPNSPKQKTKSLQSQESAAHVARSSGDEQFARTSRPQTPDRRAHGISNREYDDTRTPTAGPSYAPRSPRYTANSSPRYNHSRNGSRAAQTVNRNHLHDPYSEQSDILDDYYPPRAPHDQGRSRAALEIQRENYDGNGSNASFASRAAEVRNQHSLGYSSDSYSSKASGSRYQPDHRDSATSHPSQGSSSRSQHDSGRGQHRNHENVNPYSKHVNGSTGTRNDTSKYGRSVPYSEDTPKPRARDEYHGNSASRRGNSPQNHDDDDLDDLSSFGKYGRGL